MEDSRLSNRNFRSVYTTSSPVFRFAKYGKTSDLPWAERKRNNSPISSGIQLILVTAYSYFSVFQYERGKCKFYTIDDYLIQPDLTTCLNYSIKVFLLFLATYLIPYLLTLAIFSRTKIRSSRKIAWLQGMLMLICVSSIWVFWCQSPDSLLEFIRFVMSSLAIIIFLPIILYKPTDTATALGQIFSDTIGSQKKWQFEPAEFFFRDPLGLAAAFYSLPRKWSGPMIAAFGILMLSFSMGLKDASTQTVYDVSVNRPRFLVIQRYGDKAIMRDYDEKKHQIGSRLIVEKKDSLTYTTRYTGQSRAPVIK